MGPWSIIHGGAAFSYVGKHGGADGGNDDEDMVELLTSSMPLGLAAGSQ